MPDKTSVDRNVQDSFFMSQRAAMHSTKCESKPETESRNNNLQTAEDLLGFVWKYETIFCKVV